MKTKAICWLLAWAILLTSTTLPTAVLATEEPTDPTTATEATQPKEEPTEPSEEPTQPDEDPTEATEETSAPTDPTEESSDPTDPTEESSEPTEEPTEPPTEPDPNMKISDQMLTVLKELEGCYLECYWDYKQYSIGYGSRCPESSHEGNKTHKITPEYAEQLLRNELAYFEKEVNEFIQEKGLTITQSQYDALVSFSYNCGANWTTETTGYFHRAVLSGDLGSEFVYGMFLWSTAGGQYVLIPRRIRETYMYVQGLYKMGLWYPEDPQYRYVFMDANGGKVNYYIHGFDVNDPTGIRTLLTAAPTGPDESGGIVTYVFDGWYTARVGGTKIETLDDTMVSGTILYAHWKTPAGTPVTIPKPEGGIRLEVTVTSSVENVRCGPQTYFAVQGQVRKGDKLVITEIVVANGTWGRFEGGWIKLSSTDYSTVTKNLFPFWGKVTADGVNVRSGPGLTYGVVGQRNAGDFVKIVSWVTDGEQMWGQTEDGKYMAMSYIEITDFDPNQKVTVSLVIKQKPYKLQYMQNTDVIDLKGGVIEITFSDGTTQTMNMTPKMLSGFNNTVPGTNTLTVTYGGLTAQFDVDILKKPVVITAITIKQMPNKLQYLHKTEQLDPAGGMIEITLSDGSVQTVEMTADMLSGFDNTIPGTNTVTVTYEGMAVQFEVQIIKATVIFRMDDGTVISQQEYLIGDTVEIPQAPEKPGDKNGLYVFAGWDQEVSVCNGNAVYTAVFRQIERVGDINKDGYVTDRDAISLLRHILLPEKYPFAGTTDLNSDGYVTDHDAIYLLRHVLLPEKYPIPEAAEAAE